MTPKVTIVVLSAVCVVLALVAHTLLAFNLEGDRRWPPGKIALEMQLGASGSLIDGSADWDECGIAALVEWNENLGGAGVSFNAIRDSTRILPLLDSLSTERGFRQLDDPVFLKFEDAHDSPSPRRTVPTSAHPWTGLRKGDVPCAVETQRQLGSRLRNHL